MGCQSPALVSFWAPTTSELLDPDTQIDVHFALHLGILPLRQSIVSPQSFVTRNAMYIHVFFDV